MPGDFLLRSLPDPIRNGKQGIEVIVWYYDEVYKEWTPNQSRVLAVHLWRPADYSTDPKTGLLWRNGNMLIQTWRLFLLYENHRCTRIPSLESFDRINRDVGSVAFL